MSNILNERDSNISPVLDVRHISKVFIDQKDEIEIFKDLNFQIHKGDRIAIVGSSGAGKSTLMHIISGLDHPTSGDIFLSGHHFNKESEAKRGYLRNEYLGFIYQFHHLLPEFSALDNVALPLVIGGMNIAKARNEAEVLLGRVGLTHRLSHHPGKLSGGERQRVAIARALMMAPEVLLFDEPTAALDPEITSQVAAIIEELARTGITQIVVTHDVDFAKRIATYVVYMENGKVVEEGDSSMFTDPKTDEFKQYLSH